MKTAVITCAAGYVGASVCHAFLSRGWNVIKLGRNFTDAHDARNWQLILKTIFAAAKKALASADLQSRIEKSGAEIHFLYGPELDRFLAAESSRMTEIVKELAIKK